MKIALLAEKYTPDLGGLAISTARLACMLASAGHEVRVFAPTSSLSPFEKRSLTHEGVSITRFGAQKRVDDTLVAWFELLVEEHKRESFDVLHAYFLAQAGFVATYAGRYLGVPSVVSIRGNDIERAAFDPSRFSQVMYALQNADAITTNSSELVRKARAFFDREVILIPNGVDTQLFKPMKKNMVLAEALGLPAAGDGDKGDTPVIGFVGELREKKGMRSLLTGYAQANQESPLTLLIVGEVRAGEDKKFFDDFRLSNPQAQIIVTGQVPHADLPGYYALIDIFVHPSLRDGMPNALLEAMACERPVIVTPVGGMADVVTGGKNGLLVSVNDANSLAAAIGELLSNPEKRIELGRSARELVRSKFDMEQELNANLEVYRSLGISR